MNKGVEKERVKVIYNITPEIEKINIDHLELSDGTRNALKRVGVETVGDVLENWKELTHLIPLVGKSGVGVAKEKEAHASVFAFLMEMDCVKKLQYEG